MRDKHSELLVNKLLERFKEIRLEKGLSHEQLADIIGIHRSTISLIENKKRVPTILTCIKVAKALDIPLSKLLVDIERKAKRVAK